MKIQVKQEHIERGDRCDSNNCAIALAVKEQVPEVDPDSVCVEDTIKFDIGCNTYEIEAEGVEEFVSEFDALGGSPEPREFEIGDLEDCVVEFWD